MDVTQYMFNDVLKLNFNMLKSLSKSDNQDNYTIYHQSVIRNPTSPIYTESGDYYEQHAPLYYYNPIPYNKEHFGGYRSEMTRLTANVTVEPVSGWQTNLQLSTRRNNGLNEYYNTGKYQGNRRQEPERLHREPPRAHLAVRQATRQEPLLGNGRLQLDA